MLTFQRWFLPEDIKTQSKINQIRCKFLAVNASAAIVWGPPVVALVVSLGSPISALFVAIGAGFSLTGALYLKYCGRLSIATGIYLLGLFTMLVALSIINGGTQFSGFIWMLMLPILATDAMGERAGILTLIACLFLLMSLKFAESLGVVFPSETSQYGQEIVRYISLIVITAMIWAIGSSYSKLMHSALRHERKLSLAKSNFISNVSHELRTPLNGIIGMLEVIQQKEIEQGLRKDLDTIRYSSSHLLKLVNDILDLNSDKVSTKSIRYERYNIRDNLDKIIAPFNVLALKKNIQLSYKVSSCVPDWLIGDSTKIAQLVMNFLSNSIKFTNQGNVNLELNCVPKNAQMVELVFEINDTGIGIAKDNIELLFNPFYQVDDSATREQTGSGLGLTICKNIIDSMQGSICVKSELGEGSRFVFSVVQSTVNSDIQLTTKESIARNSVEVLNQIEGKVRMTPNKVLLVEDNEINQMVMLRMLKHKQFQVKLAENGMQALQLLEKYTFDIVLMDIQMPVMDGLACSRRIRSVLNSDIPIVAVTANASSNDFQDCLDAGINDVLAKPIIADKLYRKIADWIPCTDLE